MRSHNRREFLADVGRGMLVGSVGSALAADMELGNAVRRRRFGESLLRETGAAR